MTRETHPSLVHKESNVSHGDCVQYSIQTLFSEKSGKKNNQAWFIRKIQEHSLEKSWQQAQDGQSETVLKSTPIKQ